MKVFIHDTLAGELIASKDKFIFIVADSYEYIPTLSLYLKDYPIKSTRQKLPPFFSNLLPEGVLRDYIASEHKINPHDEYRMLSILGQDLPGAIRIETDDDSDHDIKFSETKTTFSLGGEQWKFSGIFKDGRFITVKHDGTHILKPPHAIYDGVPENEYFSMQMAKAIGIAVPDISLEEIDGKIHYVIKRFDRNQNNRIHMEDFAQVFQVYPDKKYESTNYETIAKAIDDPFGIAHYVLASLLIGNSDQHMKNLSILYIDQINPILAPLYDMVSTIQFIEDRNLALNFSKTKHFYAMTEEHFLSFAKRLGANEKEMMRIVSESIELARQSWPEILNEAPQPMKDALNKHWKALQLKGMDFSIS